MQLGLYGTTALAAARLASVFKVSRLLNMANRGMKSKPHVKSAYSKNNLTNNERGQSPSWNTSEVAYEEAFPTLSAASNSLPKSKRRTRVGLGTPYERKSETGIQNIAPSQLDSSTSPSTSHDNDTSLPTSFGKKTPPATSRTKNIGPMQLDASTSTGHEYDTSLPTNFWKKTSPSSSKKANIRQTYREHGETKSQVSPAETTMDEPFDICLPETRKPRRKRSSVHGKNSVTWVPKVQSADEIAQHKDNMEKINDMEYSVEEFGQVLRPGMVLFKHYIPLSEQVDIVNRCQELGRGPGGFYRPGYSDGAKLRLYMMCLGLDWNPQTRRYREIRHHDNVAPPGIPEEFTSLVHRALDESHTLIKRELETENVEDILPSMSPDVCIVNFYTTTGRLGLHQDRDESRKSLGDGIPVVSISIGDSAEFLYGDDRDVDEAERVLLESGDVLIFGGESRLIFHGVKTIIPNTAPELLLENTRFRPGRLNLTFRKY